MWTCPRAGRSTVCNRRRERANIPHLLSVSPKMKRLLTSCIVVLLVAVMVATAQQPQQKTDTVAKAGAPRTMAAGKAIYAKYCMACHQADGGGVPNLNPPLIKTTYVLD